MLDKPIQVGFAILEISKVIMHKLWVQLKEIFGDRIFLMYTDTDRFKVHIESEDTYQEFMTHFKDKMDTSNIKKDTRLPYIPGLNRKVLMLLKDENGDDVMTGFTGAAAKAYIEITHSTKKVTNKGIKKPLIYKMTPHDFYDATFKGKKIC